MVDGNNVYIPESMFDGGNGDFKSIMERVYSREVGCGSGTSSDDNNRYNIPSSGTNIIEERVVFGAIVLGKNLSLQYVNSMY
jgi:hypothetical protein